MAIIILNLIHMSKQSLLKRNINLVYRFQKVIHIPSRLKLLLHEIDEAQSV